MTRDTEETLSVRFRKASRLAQKKYVTNSSELFDLGAARLETLEGLVNLAWQLGPRVAQLMDSVRQEWSQSGDWTEWDQQVRDETTAMLRAIDESRAALHQEGIAPDVGRNPATHEPSPVSRSRP